MAQKLSQNLFKQLCFLAMRNKAKQNTAGHDVEVEWSTSDLSFAGLVSALRVEAEHCSPLFSRVRLAPVSTAVCDCV